MIPGNTEVQAPVWERLSEAWRACVAEAWAAWCAGSIPIGAAIATADGSVLAVGRNRVREDAGGPGQLFGHKLAHAEMNALLAFSQARRPGGETKPDPAEYVMHASTEPCNACAGAMLVAGIGELRYASRDPWGGAATLVTANPQLRPNPVVKGPEHNGLELVLMGLGAAYWRRQPGGFPEPLIRTWGQEVPAALELGKVLYESRLLEDLRAAGADAAEMLEAVGRCFGPETRTGSYREVSRGAR